MSFTQFTDKDMFLDLHSLNFKVNKVGVSEALQSTHKQSKRAAFQKKKFRQKTFRVGVIFISFNKTVGLKWFRHQYLPL